MPIQMTYSTTYVAGVAGMPADGGDVSGGLVSYTCSEDIPFGRIVELSSGQVRLPQGTTSTMTLAGVALYSAVKESSLVGSTAIAWKSGDVVPVLRRGRVWTVFTGTTVPVDGAALNVMHSSTTATNRGKVTDASTATTSGAEITAAPASFAAVSDPSVSGLCIIEVNLP